MPDAIQTEANSRYSFLARYGETILRGGIATIPAALFRYQAELGLSPQTVWFISAILSHKWDADMPHPSMKRMAEETGVSRQMLHTYQRQLVAAGWLTVINRRTERGGKDTSFYDFTPLFAKLAELLDRDKPGNGQRQDDSGSRHTHVNHSLHTHVNQTGHAHVNADGHLIEPVLEADEDPSKFERSHDEQFADAGEARPPARIAPDGPEPARDASEPAQRLDVPAALVSPLTGPENAPQGLSPQPAGSPDFRAARAAIRAILADQQRLAEAGGRRSRRAEVGPSSPPASSGPAAPPAAAAASLVRRRGRPVGSSAERELVGAFLGDFNAELLHDDAALPALITQAIHIFQAGAIPLDQWPDYLYQARTLVKERAGAITKVSVSNSERKNRGPYYFAVLRELVAAAAREERAGP